MDIFWLRRRLFLVIVVLVLLNLATLLILWLGRPDRPAPPGAGRGPDQEQAHIERLLKDELGLDQTQIQEYLRVRQQHREQIKSLDNDIRQLKRQMFEEVLADQPEPRLSDSLLALTQEKQALIERLTFQQFLDLKRLCKPEQREKLRSLIHELFKGKSGGDEPSAPPPSSGNERPPRPSGDEAPPPRPSGDEAQPSRPSGERPAPPRPSGDEPPPPRPSGDQPPPPPPGGNEPPPPPR